MEPGWVLSCPERSTMTPHLSLNIFQDEKRPRGVRTYERSAHNLQSGYQRKKRTCGNEGEGHSQPRVSPHSSRLSPQRPSTPLPTLAVPTPCSALCRLSQQGLHPAFPSVHSSLLFSPAGPPPLSSFTMCDGQVLPALSSYETGPMEALLAL